MVLSCIVVLFLCEGRKFLPECSIKWFWLLPVPPYHHYIYTLLFFLRNPLNSSRINIPDASMTGMYHYAHLLLTSFFGWLNCIHDSISFQTRVSLLPCCLHHKGLPPLKPWSRIRCSSLKLLLVRHSVTVLGKATNTVGNELAHFTCRQRYGLPPGCIYPFSLPGLEGGFQSQPAQASNLLTI